MISGLVIIEYLKYLSNKINFNNFYINTGLSFYTYCEPISNKLIWNTENLENMKLSNLIKYIETKYKSTIMMICNDQKILFDNDDDNELSMNHDIKTIYENLVDIIKDDIIKLQIISDNDKIPIIHIYV